MGMTHLTLGDYETNCYIVYDEATRAAVVIDPGDDAERVLGAVGQLRLELKAVLFTHGHYDHVGASGPILAAACCPAWLHPEDLTMPAYLRRGLVYTDLYREGDEVAVDGLRFKVLHTPGHTPGSCVLLCGDWMFSGDTLFRSGCGRTDSVGGSWLKLNESLARLGRLEGDYQVFPGHGDATTLNRERRANQFLIRAMKNCPA